MDNDQLLNQIQVLLEGMETRMTERFEKVAARLDNTANWTGKSGVLAWSSKVEAALTDIKARLAKLEGAA